jgi:hypothetical protein
MSAPDARAYGSRSFWNSRRATGFSGGDNAKPIFVKPGKA